MIDRRFIGRPMPPFSVAVDAGQPRCLAKAIGEADPVYSDDAAARVAG